MVPTSTITCVRTFDGLHLAATLVTADRPSGQAVVMVHGGGVTREEGGSSPGSPRAWPMRVSHRCGSIFAVTAAAKANRKS